MKGSFYEFTDAGRRSLMHTLASELSDEKIKELLAPYTDRLSIDRDNEFFIRFNKSEILCCYADTFDLYIEQYDIETITYNEEDDE